MQVTFTVSQLFTVMNFNLIAIIYIKLDKTSGSSDENSKQIIFFVGFSIFLRANKINKIKLNKPNFLF